MRCLIFFAILAVIFSNVQAQDEPTKVTRCGSYATYFACGANCDRVCATLNEPCTIQYFRCPSGCYCDNGYARNAAGTCIPTDQC